MDEDKSGTVSLDEFLKVFSEATVKLSITFLLIIIIVRKQLARK